MLVRCLAGVLRMPDGVVNVRTESDARTAQGHRFAKVGRTLTVLGGTSDMTPGIFLT